MHLILRSTIRYTLLFSIAMCIVAVNITAIKAVTNEEQTSIAYKKGTSSNLSNSRPSEYNFNFTTTMKPAVNCIPFCGKENLQYSNGPVQIQPKAYLIFWGAYWTTTKGKAVSTVVRNYFNDVSGTRFENILSQYYMINSDSSYSYISDQLQFVNNQTHIWTDSKVPPSDNSCGSSIKTVEDISIQNEVKAAIKNKIWPNNDINTTYFVYTPPGYAVNTKDISGGGCSNPKNYCGYHWGALNFTKTALIPPFYAEMVYPGTPNIASCSSVPNQKSAGDPLANASSHEQFETTTDPELTGWNDPTLGRGSGEIGDKCKGNFTVDPTRLNNSGVFELQGEYSNATDSCVNSFSPVNTSTDIAPPCSLSTYSLRCAITQANTDGNGDTILFNIPSTDSGCKPATINGQNVYVCTITPTSGLPQLLASHITIDGYTQPGAQKNTLSIGSGDNAIITIRIDGAKTGGGLVLNNSASYDTIRGLEITGFNPYGILLNTSTNTNNTITGNFVGTDGVNALGNGVGIYIGGGSQNNTVGGQTPDTANIISGNSGQGILIGAGSGNTIEGNYIGTDTSGTATLRKGSRIVIPNPMSSSGIPNNAGIYVFANANGNMIGGITPASANIIGHNTYGVATDNSSNTNIIGNRINANVVGVFAENGETGDSISQNTIANNTTEGILVGNSSSDHVHVFMLDNSIFSNGGSGIDLYPGGTVNCSGPTAGAPNDYTACPVIQAATTTQVHGTACVGCRVEVYVATNDADDQGHGEGPTFISSVNADSSGNWSVSVSLSAGTWVTATATTPSSPGPEETSEFAADVAVSNPVSGGNLWITGHDADYHCSQGDPGPGAACHYLLVAVNFVMRSSTLPILALDHGSQVATAITDAFGSSAPTVVTVDPRTGFATLPLVDTSGKPLYSAIIVASDTTCGGCDNNDGDGVTPDSDAINARTADIQTFFNAGGGILALAGADNYSVFYNFLPVQATGATTNPPYTLTSLGLSLGLVENQDDNCCQTHNSFQLPSSGSQFQVAETDAAGLAETMIVQNGTAVAWKRPVNSRLRPAHEPRN